MPSINQHILEHVDAEARRLRAEVKRLRCHSAELLEALHCVANAAELEVAQSIACAAIAIAITKEHEQ